MLPYVIEGLIFGLGLAVSLGPIFIALTQTSIEKGVWPGMTVGVGIWISDLLFLMLLYNFIASIKNDIESETFRFWMGISGAIVMVGFGLFMILKKPQIDYEIRKHNYKNYIGFWLKGFLVNSINPFTFFFWVSVISTYIIGRDITHNQALVLLGTILIVIILSDTAKVFLANSLKKRLTTNHVNNISNFSGFILLAFGLFMFYQVI